ncbi:hypothetical protein HA402_013403 [Bradysia odoriphaga]|nr:hypothetical protein HA402_013403 [Bradysia odoriphaga]
MNPSGHRVSQFYHKALNPTTIPVVIDNKLCLLTEQLSRHIVDTKISFIIPHPQMYFGPEIPEYSPPLQTQSNLQFPPDQMLNQMAGNVEQQIMLERMRGQYFVDMMLASANYANQHVASHSPWKSGITQPRLFVDASTHTLDLTQPDDVEMKTIP